MKKEEAIMKERLQGIIVGLLIGTLSAGSVVYAKGGIENIQVSYDNIKVYKDNQLYALKDSSGKTIEPFVYNGTTYLPLRSAANLAGMDVTWDNATKSVYLWDEVSGPEKAAADMMEVCPPYETEWGCKVFKKNDGLSFSMAGKNYVSGMTFEDSSFALFNLGGKYSEMTLDIGSAFNTKDYTAVFTVDGKVVKEMRVIGSKLPETVTIPLNHGSQLRIDVFSDVLLAKCGMANITVK